MLEFWGTIFIILIGSVSHFLYDWTNHNKVIGYFTAVNESTWEHLKLVIFPSLIWLCVEYHYYLNNLNFLFARFISLLVILFLIPGVFYTYTHFTKKPILIIDILSFIISVIIGQVIFLQIVNINYGNQIFNHIGIIGLLGIFFVYIMNTYAPRENFLNKDPVTNEYGIKGHHDHKKD